MYSLTMPRCLVISLSQPKKKLITHHQDVCNLDTIFMDGISKRPYDWKILKAQSRDQSSSINKLPGPEIPLPCRMMVKIFDFCSLLLSPRDNNLAGFRRGWDHRSQWDRYVLRHVSWQSWAGWWLSHPSEKYYIVNWDDDIPNIWKNRIHVPNHQPGSV